MMHLIYVNVTLLQAERHHIKRKVAARSDSFKNAMNRMHHHDSSESQVACNEDDDIMPLNLLIPSESALMVDGDDR